MILFRLYITENDQAAAAVAARGYLLILKRVAPFKVKLVQPYWKVFGQYEVLMEAENNTSSQVQILSEIVLLLGVSPQMLSKTEAIWSDLNDDFPLFGVSWAHIELI